MADRSRIAASRIAPDTTLTLSRGLAAGLAGFGAVLVAWAGVTGWYLAFRDEVAQGLFARQTELRYGYEDRIAELSGRLEREVTANSVERRGMAARAEALARRQAELEARQAWLAGLADRIAGGASHAGPLPSAPMAPPVAVAADPEPQGAKPVPIPSDLRLRRPGEAAAERRAAGERLSALEGSVARVADATYGTADSLRRHARDRAFRLRLVLDTLRLDPKRIGSAEPAGGAPMGGPLVALPSDAYGGAFGLMEADAEAGLAEFDRLATTARGLPLRRPLEGTPDVTSPFGYRTDPFTRGPALHTGMDLRAEAGAPVRATAAGRVGAAEPTGGYGNMVEIEHDGGIATRYGHLMSIAVVPGQAVSAGQIVGRVGSTGRSTGFHLHYETRIGGEPVNPTRFLDAARLLASADAAL